MIAGAEHCELIVLDGSAVGADGATAGEYVGERVEVSVPGDRELGAGRERHVRVGDRRVGDAGAFEAGDVAGDESYHGAAVVGGEQHEVVTGDRLVTRRRHLERSGKVDP